ncbi:MAG TPA: hypothetical protein P5077_05995 [bacterium]|nr:hypothetical protein [bacterium]
MTDNVGRSIGESRWNRGAWWCSPLLAMLSFLVAFFRTPDGDAFTHLAQGRYILDQEAVPLADAFSIAFHGKEWVNWEWLHNVVLALVWGSSGYAGVFLLRLLVVFATVALLFAVLRKISGNTVVAFLLAGAALLLMQSRIQDRPHLFSYLFIALTLFALFPRRPLSKGSLAALFLLLLCWRNVHPSWPLGIALIGSVIIEERWRRGLPVVETDLRAVLLSLPALLILYLATPHPQGFDIYLALQTQGGGALGEWAPIVFSGVRWWTPVRLLFFALVLVMTISSFLTRSDGALYRLLALAMVLNAFWHIRFIPEAALLGTPVVAAAFARSGLSSPSGRRESLFVLLIFALTVLGTQKNFSDMYLHRGVGPDETKNPVHAADFMAEHDLGGNIYASFPGAMDYLMHALFLKVRVAVDIRVPGLYPFEYAHRLWTISSDRDLEEYVLSLPLDHIVLGAPDFLAPKREHEWGIEKILLQRGWALLYFDRHFALYGREDRLGSRLRPFRLLSRWNTDIARLDAMVKGGGFDAILEELRLLKAYTAGRDGFYREVLTTLYRQPFLGNEQKGLLEEMF